MDERYCCSVQAYAASFNVSESEAQLRLQKAHVTILGCGGLGGYVVEMLARSGVGNLRLVDMDTFAARNLNRQILCTEQNLGYSKADVAAARVLTVNSTVQVDVRNCRLDQKNAAELFCGTNVIVDALDAIPTRRIVVAEAARMNLPVVYGAVAGFLGQAAVVLPGNDLLSRLYPPTSTDASEELQHSMGVPASTPALIAAIQVSETLKLLLGAEPEHLLIDRAFLCDMAVPFAGIVEYPAIPEASSFSEETHQKSCCIVS